MNRDSENELRIETPKAACWNNAFYLRYTKLKLVLHGGARMVSREHSQQLLVGDVKKIHSDYRAR